MYRPENMLNILTAFNVSQIKIYIFIHTILFCFSVKEKLTEFHILFRATQRLI